MRNHSEAQVCLNSVDNIAVQLLLERLLAHRQDYQARRNYSKLGANYRDSLVCVRRQHIIFDDTDSTDRSRDRINHVIRLKYGAL